MEVVQQRPDQRTAVNVLLTIKRPLMEAVVSIHGSWPNLKVSDDYFDISVVDGDADPEVYNSSH